MSNENCCKENCDCREIEDFTDEELQNELRLRELRRLKPKSVETVDWSKLDARVRKFVDDIAKNGYRTDIEERMVFTLAIEAVFGQRVWNWINQTDFQ